MNLSFEGSKPQEKPRSPNLLRDAVVPYTADLPPRGKRCTVVLFGQPVEDRTVYQLERRSGCDLAAHALAKKLHKTGLVLPKHVAAEVELLSFLDFYAKHPNELKTPAELRFYYEAVVGDVLTRCAALQLGPQRCTLVGVVGSVNFGLQTISRFARERGGAYTLVKLSPVGYADLLAEQALHRVLHLGLDRKFAQPDELAQPHVFYEHGRGVERELAALAAIPRDEQLIVLLDCQVLASHYFPGTSVPFPFSLSLPEARRLLRALLDRSDSLAYVQLCHFNPSVEDKRSAAFLLDFLHDLVCSLSNGAL